MNASCRATGGGMPATQVSQATGQNRASSSANTLPTDSIALTPQLNKTITPLVSISSTYQELRNQIFEQLNIQVQQAELKNGQQIRGVEKTEFSKIINHINRPENKANPRQLILEWHAIFKPEANHIIIDKPQKVLYGYQAGKEIKWSGQIPVLTGKDQSDKKTIAIRTPGAGVDFSNDRQTTGAGIFIMSKGRPYKKRTMRNSYDQNNATRLVHASAQLDKQGYVISPDTKIESMIFHQVPGNGKTGNSKRRYDSLIDGDITNNAMTGGCPNIMHHDFEDMQAAGLTKPGSRLYVLPEEINKHSFKVNQYGELIFTQDQEVNGSEACEYNYFYGRQKIPKISLVINKSDRHPEPAAGGFMSKIYYERIKSLQEYPNETIGDIIARTYIETLEQYSSLLTSDLELTPREYLELSQTAYGILANESEFGTGFTYNVKEFDISANDNTRLLLGQFFVKIAKGIKACDTLDLEELQKCDTTENSRGLTQIKIGQSNQKAQKLLKKYNITPNNLTEPDKSAIGTLIFLATNYKDMLKGESNRQKLSQRENKPLTITDNNVHEYMAYLHKWPRLISKGLAGDTSEIAKQGAAYVANANKEAKYIKGLIEIP